MLFRIAGFMKLKNVFEI